MKNFTYIHFLTLGLLAGLLANCERNTLEIPEVTETNSEIELDMLVDGSPVQVTAGIDNTFNDTDVLVDDDDVYTFSGTLTTVDCGNDCANSFSVRIRNFDRGLSSFDVNQSIHERSYKFKKETEPVTDAYLLELDMISEAEQPRYSWLIDGQAYTQEDLQDIRVVDRGTANEITATLSVFDEATGLTSFYTEELHLDEDVMGVSSKIIVEQIQGDEVSLKVQHTDSDDFIPLPATLWTIEDLSGENKEWFTVLQDSEIIINIGEGKRINNNASFQVVSDATSTTVGLEIKYDEIQGVIYNEVDFDYTILDKIESGSDLALQTFEFILIDENGTIFSSAKGPQTKENLFEVLNVEPFIANDKGQSTVKIDCQFSCTVYSDDGTQKNVQNAKATIALAIP